MSVCIYCGEALRNTEEDNDHWESCADHPARKVVLRLYLSIAELQSLRSNDAVTIKMLSDQLRDYDNRLIPELQKQINKMKSCNNCNHHYGEECTDPDLSELTHEEYFNGCEHWRLKDAT